MKTTLTDVFVISEKSNKVAYFEKQIEIYEAANVLFQTIIEKVIPKFDGKKVTKRLETACNKETENMGFRLSLKHEYISCYYLNREVMKDGKFIGYSTNSEVFLRLVYDRFGCLDAKETAKVLETSIKFFTEYITEYKDAIENFDSYCELSKEIERQIEAYDEKCNRLLRLNINVNCR